MYLRTTRRKNKNDTVTEYYQLAHNGRDPANNNTVAKIVYSFGRADQLDREALVRLCKSIAARGDDVVGVRSSLQPTGLNISDCPPVELPTPLRQDRWVKTNYS